MHGLYVAFEGDRQNDYNCDCNSEGEIYRFGSFGVLLRKSLLSHTKGFIKISNIGLWTNLHTISLKLKHASHTDRTPTCRQVTLRTVCSTHIALSAIGYLIVGASWHTEVGLHVEVVFAGSAICGVVADDAWAWAKHAFAVEGVVARDAGQALSIGQLSFSTGQAVSWVAGCTVYVFIGAGYTGQIIKGQSTRRTLASADIIQQVEKRITS